MASWNNPLKIQFKSDVFLVSICLNNALKVLVSSIILRFSINNDMLLHTLRLSVGPRIGHHSKTFSNFRTENKSWPQGTIFSVFSRLFLFKNVVSYRIVALGSSEHESVV